MVHAAIEHEHEHVEQRRPTLERRDRAAHDVGDGRLGAATFGEHAAAQVAIGEDAVRRSGDEHGTHAALAHDARGLAGRRAERDAHGIARHERPGGAAEIESERRRLQRRAAPEPVGEVEQEELAERRGFHELLEHRRGDPVREHVLGCDHVHVRARAPDQRRERERVPLLEHLHRRAVALQAHRALAHHVEVLGAGPAPAQRELTAREIDDLEGLLHGAERRGAQLVERGLVTQELGRFHDGTPHVARDGPNRARAKIPFCRCTPDSAPSSRQSHITRAEYPSSARSLRLRMHRH